jgi:hypothetical protein
MSYVATVADVLGVTFNAVLSELVKVRPSRASLVASFLTAASRSATFVASEAYSADLAVRSLFDSSWPNSCRLTPLSATVKPI